MIKEKDEKAFHESIISYNKENNVSGIKEKYSFDVTFEGSDNAQRMTQEQIEVMKIIEGEIIQRLEAAVLGNVKTDCLEALEIAELHKKWLGYVWGKYSQQAHIALVMKYDDEKYKNYYDSKVEGCARFLKTAVQNYITRDRSKTFEYDGNVNN